MTLALPTRRDIAAVPVHFINTTEGLVGLGEMLASAVAVAIDTETYGWYDGFGGYMRVLSAAVRDADGAETAYVVDARDADVTLLASYLDGVTARAWNANFDSLIIARAIYEPLGLRDGIVWWDGMFADALLYSGQVGFSFYHGLALTAKRLCGVDLDGKGTTQTSFDADSDLTGEQITYAARDAIATLWVCDHLEKEIADAGLARILDLELGARPFLNAMQVHGLPFDWDGWSGYLAQIAEERGELLDEISQMTGGGQPDLFTGRETPSWNVDSGPALRAKLNQYAAERVKAHFAAKEGKPRLLGASDTLQGEDLKEIGGELCDKVLAYRNAQKLVSTYGENIRKHIGSDGRMHPEYRQITGTDTGRLASRNPNAQNFSPKMKPYFRPLVEGRVFVYADLSQAELRDLAHESGDEAMRDAFRQGRDIHVATAERMFGVNMDELKTGDPAQFKIFRSKAKTLNFGIVYGLGYRALAKSLTLSGVPTTDEEAQGLLAAYLAAYPGVAAWLAARDNFIRGFAQAPPMVDWQASCKLSRLRKLVDAATRKLRKELGRIPDVDEIAREMRSEEAAKRELERELGREPSAEELAASYQELEADIAWANKFEGAVVLSVEQVPVRFASRTAQGRRRTFEVSHESLMMEMAYIAARSTKGRSGQLRSDFAATTGVWLTGAKGRTLMAKDLKKVFEDRGVRDSWVNYVLEASDDYSRQFLIQKALSECLSRMGNAYRNAPIQGGVADVVLAAYGKLNDTLARYRDVWPVQTVHDSITLEVWEEDAPAVMAELKAALETSMSEVCDSIPAVADADIRPTLKDPD